MRRLVPAPLALVATLACADGAARSFPHLDELPALALEETLRIGSVDDPDVGFSNVGNVHVTPAGELWVAENGDLEIRRYGADGARIGSYGQEGEGPGEFRRIDRFGLVDDTLWVADGTARRLTLMSVADGRVLATVTGGVEFVVGDRSALGGPSRSPIAVTSYPAELRPGGLIVGSLPNMIYPNLPDSVIDMPHMVFDLNGQVIDTLEMVRVRVSRPARTISMGGNRTRIVYLDAPAHDSGTFRREMPDGTLDVHWRVEEDTPLATLSVLRLSTRGDTLERADVRYDPRPIPAGYADSVAGALAGRGSPSPADSAVLFRAHLEAIQLPPHFRPIGPLRPAEDGGVWVPLTEGDPAVSRWLVVGSEGSVRGIVHLPPAANLRWVDGDVIWTLERDAFDVPWLVRYTLDAPGPT